MIAATVFAWALMCLSQAARIAGLERKFLYKLLERAGLRTPKQDAESDEDKP